MNARRKRSEKRGGKALSSGIPYDRAAELRRDKGERSEGGGGGEQKRQSKLELKKTPGISTRGKKGKKASLECFLLTSLSPSCTVQSVCIGVCFRCTGSQNI